MRGVYWLKRDFRLSDNPSLARACQECEEVFPIYILEPSLLTATETSIFHLQSIYTALIALARKIPLQFYYGEARDILKLLHRQLSFDRLYSHEEVGLERTFARDRSVRRWSDAVGVKWIEDIQTGVFRALPDRDQRSGLWKKFTYAPLAVAQIQVCKELPNGPDTLTGSAFEKIMASTYSFPDYDAAHLQPVSEEEAQHTLQDFLYHRSKLYKGGISSPRTAFSAGSRLSVHLAWGTISGREVYQKTQARLEELKQDPQGGPWRASLRTFLSRLHWRDHFIQRLESEPETEFRAINPVFEQLVYDTKPEHLQAWIQGATGFPMVDACIRCLRQTGFMNFRMRAMITSAACHLLHIDWKLIDRPMARMYTDYEPGIHLSQLQMQANVVGINTLRIYSPRKQIEDQDPDAGFVKQWLPELRKYTAEEIIAHEKHPLKNYPPALVDWKEASSIMRSKLWQIRKLPQAKEITAEVYRKHGSRKRN